MLSQDLTISSWRKSSHSGSGTTTNCVELASGYSAAHHVIVAVRDSKHPDGPVLRFAPAALRSLRDHLRTV